MSSASDPSLPSSNQTVTCTEAAPNPYPTGIVTGAGDDSVTIQGGTINGSVNQGAGADRFSIGAGTVAGAVQQGNGIDDFRMTGGTIASLQQGDNRDTFFMSGGTITGAFEDGDVATMTGGTIGRVDMKLDNNVFVMSGGTIRGNLVTGFGNDTITLSDGTIGGNISVSGGTDAVTVTGGHVFGEIRMSTGTDTFTWSDGGQIDGLIDLGPDDDTALLRNLGAAQLTSNAGLAGGTGTDTLTLQNVQTERVARYTQWERIQLQGSRLSLDGNLVLGDAGTGTGTLSIDAASTVLAVAGTVSTVSPAAAGANVTVNNAGTLDLTGGQASNRMTIVGNYNGLGGQVKVESVLGADDAPSDRLIVSQGAIGGASTLAVANLGGAGAPTALNGIMVVQASNGATSSNTAFALPGTLKAGAYEYFLYKGGETAGSENNWYLRSTVPAVPTAASVPEGAAPAATAPVAAPVMAASEIPGATLTMAPAPLPAPSAQAVPIYRDEVPLYGALPATARQLAFTTLGTFHDRQGSQSLLREQGRLPAGWARAFGENSERHYGGDTQAEFDGSIGGMQLGQDLYSKRYDGGAQDRIGVFLGYAHADGNIKGLALATPHAGVGNMDIDGYSAGTYWTHVGDRQWYTDAVAMVTHLDARLRSHGGMRETTNGTATTLSLEAGYPLAVTDNWSLEPQAQFVAQFLSVDSLDDDISHVAFKDADTYTGRIGARLAGHYGAEGHQWEPYFRVNLLKEFSGTDKTVYGGADSVTTQYGSTSVQFGAGVAAQINRHASLYAALDYVKDVDGDYRRGLAGSVGVRVRW
ncbi:MULTISPECIES: autotransporter outer membrane beta-barrel domain-containing protein [unclassified Achromobacter]|uniref:autotransporter family protein n=1 Tax=unclassified Achromobacter TaxID=2626865 RepID=UPI001302FD79|nr:MULTISPECIES: autotransporter outer membrane beta-barrel domain-containing protein [unclassified Achromobacter]